ncbi:FAD-dependent oxidoreductase [Deltaproteobacteria bacterium]|nr:FAD-dependent oxidoreductase [Deltaproteobacteria bacterium]
MSPVAAGSGPYNATSPYWLDGAAPLAPELEGSVTADVVVVGAGVCGASVAWALAQAGVQVAWVEARGVSEGASGRNAGFVLQGTCERYSRAVGLMGRERARAVHQASRDNHLAMATVIEELGLECGYMRRGSLQLAGSEQEEGELLESAAMLREDGFSAEVRAGEGLDELYQQAGFRVGVHIADDGELDPARFVRGVAQAAVGRGVRLFERSPVLEIAAPSPGEAYVRTARGEVRAQLVLVCTNAYAGEIIPWYADKVDPVRGQMLATAPAPPMFSSPVYADHGYDYWRQDEAGRVVLGGWRNLDVAGEKGTAEVLHAGIQERMGAFLERFPGMRGVPITHRWSGTMGFSRDGLPIVGAVPGLPGALGAVGFTGHGFGFAWVCGQALVELSLQGTSEIADRFSSRRFVG